MLVRWVSEVQCSGIKLKDVSSLVLDYNNKHKK